MGQYDVVIKGGMIVLETGEIQADIAIKDGKIAKSPLILISTTMLK